jgi:hypothetical protein
VARLAMVRMSSGKHFDRGWWTLIKRGWGTSFHFIAGASFFVSCTNKWSWWSVNFIFIFCEPVLCCRAKTCQKYEIPNFDRRDYDRKKIIQSVERMPCILWSSCLRGSVRLLLWIPHRVLQSILRYTFSS